MEIRLFGTVNDSIVDGPGLRYAIFTQGCFHNCLFFNFISYFLMYFSHIYLAFFHLIESIVEVGRNLQ
jgi:hypothetical protein